MEKAFELYPRWFGKRTSEVVAFAEERELAPAPITNPDGDVFFAETRKANIRLLQPFDERTHELDRTFTTLMRRANASFGLDVTHIAAMQFATYGIGDQHDWHDDVLWHEGFKEQRKLTMVMQLSDPMEYDGGDFRIRPKFGAAPDPNLLRERGSVLIFPAFTEHRVMPITRGVRKSLSVFFVGPHLR